MAFNFAGKSKWKNWSIRSRKGNAPFRAIILGFLLTVLIGALLLTLPVSTREAGHCPFSDALFTAVSAGCVTGLAVHDTATYWSLFGQVILFLLIEIGGVGVITLTVALAMLSGKKIGILQRSIVSESISAENFGGILNLAIFILKFSAVIELTGAILTAPVFISMFGLPKGLWYAVFHSASAYCNAGFDLMGAVEPSSSLTYFMGQPWMVFVTSALIIAGGAGFLTWDDILIHRLELKKYRLQSKLILIVTAVLLVLPFLYFWLVEFRLSQWSWMSGKERFLAAVFQTVTPRTAGFNTVDMTAYSGTGKCLTIFLMLIGGSPGSTAGGMKMTTLGVLALSAMSAYTRTRDVNFMKRRIEDSVVKNAAAILLLYLFTFLGGAMLISTLEGLPMDRCMFETASAVATVGLSLNLTPILGTVSRILLMLMMFMGRVGGMTLIYATLSAPKTYYRYPGENITVG